MAKILPFAVAAAIAAMISPRASADFDGPAPLAWRWAQSSNTIPSGTPLVDHDAVYVAVGARVFALDRATGNQKWKFPTVENVDGYFQGTPLMCDGVVVTATAHTLYGIDPATGLEKWYYKVPDALTAISGQPVSTTKSVVFKLGEENLMAVNGADGKPSWQNPQHVYDRLRGNLGAFSDSVFYFTQQNDLDRLNVLSPADVKKIVRFSQVSEDATPVVSSDILYVSSGSFVAALNAFSGGPRWQRDTGQDLVFGPAASGSGVAAISRDGVLILMDLDGHVRSRYDETKKVNVPLTVDLGSGPVAQPIAAGKFFIVPTYNGVLNMVDSTNGDIVWRYTVLPMGEVKPKEQTGTTKRDVSLYTVAAAGAPVAAGDTLLLLAKDGSLLAFDKDSGVDVTGPEVKMGWPADGAQVSSVQLDVLFRVTDESSGVNDKTLKILINGKPATFEYTADGLATVNISQYAANQPLPDGRADFEVIVSDYVGNVTDSHHTLLVDNSLPILQAPKPQTENPTGGGGRAGGKGGGGGG